MLRQLIQRFSPTLMSKIRTESQRWFMQCQRCGFEISVWAAGGMRYKALGSVYRFGRCNACNHIGWLRVYKSTHPVDKQNQG